MMRKHSIPVLTMLPAICLLWLSAPAQAANFKLEADGGNPLYRSEVPIEVYQSTRVNSLGDITVRNAASERVPHVLLDNALLNPPAVVTDSTLKLPVFALPASALQYTTTAGPEELKIQLEKNVGKTTVYISQNASGAARNSLYLLDAGEQHKPISKLTLEWAETDANMLQMEVLASNDLNTWTTVGRGVLLKTANAAGTILQNAITLESPSDARYLQLRTDSAQWLTITGAVAHFSTLMTAPSRLLWQTLPKAQRTDDEKTGITSIEFEADGRYPAEFLRINLGEDNTIAAVRVAVRNKADEPWRAITSASLYRMRQRGAPSQDATVINPDITIYPTVARYWQLQFSQATGGIGASSPSLAVGWPVQTLVWNARGNGPFSLQTGADTAANHVTIQSLIPDFKREKLQQLPVAAISLDTTSGTTNHSSWATAEPEDNKRWWLWGGLVLGVLILAGMAISLLKSTTSKPDPAKSGTSKPNAESPGRDS